LIRKCLFYVNILSKIKSKHLIELDEGIDTLFRVMFGHIPCLSVNVIYIDDLF